eukprot:m.76594 g.76594  ORF g.76594 m.76594 type:complete len:270 (-) comp14516_c0_seq2:53-862(-)
MAGPPTEQCCTFPQVLLYVLNTVYILLGIVLVTVAAVARQQALVSSLPILIGIVVAGFFLILIAILGIVGAGKRSQAFLFLYMFLMVLLFIIQFFVSVAALATTSAQQETIARAGWCRLDDTDKGTIQSALTCIGFDDINPANFTDPNSPDYCLAPGGMGDECHLWIEGDVCQEHGCAWDETADNSCYSPGCPIGCTADNFCTHKTAPAPGAEPCQPCFSKLKDDIERNVRRGGGVGLGFAFVQLLGIAAAYWFRKTVRYDTKYERVYL